MVRKHGMGIEDRSSNIPFTSSDITREFLYYPMWLGHFYCGEGYKIDRETYPAILLAYVIKGKFHIVFREQELIATAGDVVFMDCREKHCYFSEKGTEFLFINYSGQNSHEICQLFMKQYGWIVKKKTNNILYGKLRDMIEYYEQGGISVPVRDSERIYSMTMTMLEPDSSLDMENDVIYKSIVYIRSHISEMIRLKDLADQAALSVYYFSHKFKERTGFAPMDYVTNTRIEKVKRILLETDISVEDIAAQVGYASSAGLIKAFKKNTGMSPRRYRKSETGR